MLICIGAVSCQKENNVAVQEDPAAGVTTGNSIKVRLENRQDEAQTKLTIDSSTGASSWSAGDQIAFCVTNGSTTSYQTETVNTATSEIPYNVPSGYDRANYAIYPAASKGSDYTSPTIVYPSSYDLSGKTAESYSPMPMVAVNGSGLLDFYHVGGLLRLKLTEVDEATSKVTVTFDDVTNICGTYTVANAGTSDATLSLSSGAGNVITFTGVSVASGTAWVNIPLPAGASVGTVTVKTINSSNAELQSMEGIISWSGVGRKSARQYLISPGPPPPPAYLPGEFSVSSTKKVQFARGNLQAVIDGGPTNTYNYTASEWKFAENQYDYIGNAAGNTSFEVGTTVDLFCWVATSVWYNSHGLCVIGALDTWIGQYFGFATNDSLSDWGTITEIIETYGEGWHTLSKDEWTYLLSSGRTNAANKRATATVCSVPGLLILPDDWTLPDGCSFTVTISDYTTNVYDETAWDKMEAAGAVFLPAAGSRTGTSVNNAGATGLYWSSSPYPGNPYGYKSDDKDKALALLWNGSGNLNVAAVYYRYYGRSVRLVRNAE